ncbi:MAG: TnpV protein [Clostridia bacterium]|nr:TnpV protein [Clostridia bacterium]
MNIDYIRSGDYLVPNFVLPEKEYCIDKYGRLRKAFLKERHKGTYAAMLLDGTLYDHLQEIDEVARDFVSRAVKQLAEKEGVTEKLKAENQMEWVRRMNGIKAMAEEAALVEFVYV